MTVTTTGNPYAHYVAQMAMRGVPRGWLDFLVGNQFLPQPRGSIDSMSAETSIPVDALKVVLTGLTAAVVDMKEGREKEHAAREVALLKTLMEGTRTARANSWEQTPIVLLYLRAFIHVHFSLATIAMHTADPAAVYFGAGLREILITAGLETFK